MFGLGGEQVIMLILLVALITIVMFGPIMRRIDPHWNNSAFLLGGLWYLYYQMWLKGLTILVIQLLLTILLGGTGIIGMLLVGFYCGKNGAKDLAFFLKEGRENFSDITKRMKGLTKICPFCAEEIKAEAKVCRYCGKELPADA